MEEDLLSKNGAELEQPCKKKKAEEEFLHNIDLEALKKETNLSLEEIAAVSGINEARNLGKWAQGKPNGSRPNYNAIVRLMRAGATQKTLFGVEPKQPDPETTGSESIDYNDPKFQEAVERALKIYEQRKQRGIIK